MMRQTKPTIRAIMPALAAAALLALAGCATQQPYGRSGDYGTSYGNGGSGSRNCANCGVVQSVQQVYVDGNNSNVLGTIIGAVAGAALGNQVGGGDGRKAATVAGAVAGGVVGNKVAQRNDSGRDIGYRVTVSLDNGRTATVTQRQDPRVRPGDRVQVRSDHVYML